MKIIKGHLKHLKKLSKIKREKYHPLIHKIHKKHNISKKTLFYVKEYGPHSHVAKTIIKESIKILLLASIISSFGGLALEGIKQLFISILPLVILLPTLNDMIGGYGTIISSRFSTMLHEGKIKRKNLFKNKDIKELVVQLLLISLLTALLSTFLALVISRFSGYGLDLKIIIKILLIVILNVLFLVSLLIIVSIAAGFYFYNKKEDPNNFLIPITTSIADFGNMVILSILILIFF